MTDEELIKRLRLQAEQQNLIAKSAMLCAAIRIEELVKDLADGSFYKETTIDALIDRAERAEVAEAKLAKAVAALMQLQLIVGDILGAHMQDSESRDKAIGLIKTTLAELEKTE